MKLFVDVSTAFVPQLSPIDENDLSGVAGISKYFEKSDPPEEVKVIFLQTSIKVHNYFLSNSLKR